MTSRTLIKKVARLYASSPYYFQLPLGIFFLFLQLVLFLKSSLFSLQRIGRILRKSARNSYRRYRTLLTQGFHRFFHKPQKRGRKPLKKHTPLRIAKGVGITFIFFIVLGLGSATAYFFWDLPNPQILSTRQVPQTTKIFDRNGTLLYQIYANQNRTLVPLSDIPQELKEATLAIEDKNFYHHPGFDILAIARALRADIQRKHIQGASTITQQLIKSSILTPERSITRKVREVILAFWAERIYTKDQLLTMYFNQVPYGGTAWGIEAASNVYFGKHVSELNLSESAFLAGLTAAPSVYSPFGPSPELWKQRQKEVLFRMKELRYITADEEKKALAQKLAFKEQDDPLYAPHFVMYIKDLLVKRYGLAAVEKGGLQVTTTLDLPTQQMAEKIVAQEVENAAYLNVGNGAAVVTDPKNGDVIAMVGSHDYYDPNDGKVNLATAKRQPGSSIKVVTYSAALMKGFTPASILDDSPMTYLSPGAPPYSPVNYDGKFHGKVPLRLALGNSFNIPAVKLLQQIGVPTMVDLAREMGISSWGDPSEYGLSLTLGSAETTMIDMATVFGTLANEGLRVDIDPIQKITQSDKDLVEEKREIKTTRVFESSIAYLMSHMLSDNAARAGAFGPNSPLVIPGHTVSVKTGTSDNKKDNWTDGYTKDFVVITWVGNNNGDFMNPYLASGITGAAPIWHGIMENLLKGKQNQPLTPPDTIVRRWCFGHEEYFVRGTENTAGCTNFFPTHAGASANDQ